MKLRIAIVDDNKIIQEKVEQIVRRELKSCQLTVQKYAKAESLLFDEEQEFDIYLLDIEMYEINGIELAGEIRRRGKTGEIVFLTSHEQYARLGYQSHAYAYLLKQSMEEELSKVLQDIKEKFYEHSYRYYVIENANRFEKILLEEIIYIYKEDKNCIFVTAGENYQERITIGKVEERLGIKGFVFADKGCLVNIQHIERIVGNTIHLTGGIKFQAARSHMKKLKDAVHNYWSNRL